MRTVMLAALLLSACGGESLVVTIPTKPGETNLDMEESPPLRRYQYKLEVTSSIPKKVELEARIEDPVPEGMVARLAGTTSIPRGGMAWPWLVVIVPEKPGPFRGTLAITSPDVPDWATRYTFEGKVVAGPREGRNLSVRPPGVDLGMVRPGEEKPFAVALSSFGSEDVTIKDWTPSDPTRVRIPRLKAPLVVKSGGEFQLAGIVVAPGTAGDFDAHIRVETDAENYQGGLFVIRFAGRVVPDYFATPPRAVETVAYPVQETEFKVVIRAREGVRPFTVAEAAGHERYLDVLSLGTPEPAAEQVVRLKLRRDAPTDATRDAEWQVRFRLEPGGAEVAWPVRIRLNPPIHPAPVEVRFGTVAQGAEKEAEILITALANRTFRVTGAHAQNRLVRVTLPEHSPGTSWRVIVALPGSLAAGNVEDRVIIDTDDPDVPRLIVPVRAEIR